VHNPNYLYLIYKLYAQFPSVKTRTKSFIYKIHLFGICKIFTVKEKQRRKRSSKGFI